jgi:WD40 repeat protein
MSTHMQQSSRRPLKKSELWLLAAPLLVLALLCGRAIYNRFFSHSLNGFRGPVDSLSFSDDGKLLASSDASYIPKDPRDLNYMEDIKVWDLASRRALFSVSLRAWVGTPIFAPDSRSVMAFVNDHQRFSGVRQWDSRSGQLLRQLPTKDVVITRFSGDGKILYGLGSPTYLWDAQTGAVLRTIPISRTDFTKCRLSRDERILLCIKGFKAQVWDVHKGKLRFTLPPKRVEDVALSPNGAMAACIVTENSGSGSLEDFSLHLYDTTTGKLIRTAENVGGKFVGESRFSPDSRWLILGGGRSSGEAKRFGGLVGKIQLFDTRTGTRKWSRFSPYVVPFLFFTRDGRTVMNSSHNGIDTSEGRLDLWDAQTGKLLNTLHETPHKEPVFALSHDGKKLAVSHGSSVDLLDLDDLRGR